jgi:hypothetical protein
MAPNPVGVFAAGLSAVVLLFVVYLHHGAPGSTFAGRPIPEIRRAEGVENSRPVTDKGLLGPAGRICCKGVVAKCLACSAGTSLAEYCREHPGTVGCASSKLVPATSEPQQPVSRDIEVQVDAVTTPAAPAATTVATVGVTTATALATVADPVVVGDCVGNNFGMLQNPRKFTRELAQAAFPDRKVVVNVLGHDCMPTADSKYDHTDLIVIVWSKYDKTHQLAIEQAPESERIRWNEDPKDANGKAMAVKGLLSYSKSRVVRHSRGRTFMIALNDEAYGQSGALYDLMIEAKLEPKYGIRHPWSVVGSAFPSHADPKSFSPPASAGTCIGTLPTCGGRCHRDFCFRMAGPSRR